MLLKIIKVRTLWGRTRLWARQKTIIFETYLCGFQELCLVRLYSGLRQLRCGHSFEQTTFILDGCPRLSAKEAAQKEGHGLGITMGPTRACSGSPTNMALADARRSASDKLKSARFGAIV